jgi:tetratricopeptide (TPR) repeat protein
LSQNPRIDELRRRVQADPASIAFAALAEEYRRDGNFTDAIDTCVAGLKRHPSYLSAHVTLGRSLIEVGRFEEAEQELQLVLRAAPENLAAIRGMADIHHRRRDQGYDEASALLQHQAQEETAPVAVGAESAGDAAPMHAPAFTPPAYESASYEPPAYETTSAEPAPYEPPAYEPPAYEPAANEPAALAAFAPATVDPPRDEPTEYQPPVYDPPGTFEFPSVIVSAPDYETDAYDMPVMALDESNPQLEALERFLHAILASRTALAAH